MKATEIKLEKCGYQFSAITKPEGSHYKFLMSLGRCFPTTRAQARQFVSTRQRLDVLNSVDVDTIEALMSKHGEMGEYRYTGHKTWVRLQNHEQLWDCIKKEYSL